MVNYQTGKIYKITSNQTDQVYIGSTCSPLSQRMANHRSCMRAGRPGHYITSFAIVQYDDAVITLVEECPCESKEQLIRRERFHIENTPNCLNRCMPGRTMAEYYQANRNQILAQKIEYRAVNREAIAARRVERIVCECGVITTSRNMAKHRRTAKHLQIVAANEPPAADLLE